MTVKLSVLTGALASLAAAAMEPCRIEVVEKGSGWPVPLVELRTTHNARFVTDNAGVIAFDLPELMGRETWFGVSVVCVIDSRGSESYGTTPMFEMPASVVRRVLDGGELGDIMGEVSGEPDIRRTIGAVGYLTKGMLTRTSMYEDGILAALAPCMSADVYER